MKKEYQVNQKTLKDIEFYLKKNEIIKKKNIIDLVLLSIIIVVIEILAIKYLHNKYIEAGYLYESVANNTKMLIIMAIPIWIIVVYFNYKMELKSIMKPYKVGDVICMIDSTEKLDYRILRKNNEILKRNKDLKMVINEEEFEEFKLILYKKSLKNSNIGIIILPIEYF
ncbi:MAG: hypothetical protein ACRDD2_09500 [Sarcina sp.]